MAKKPSKAWKAFERAVSKYFNTTRTPLSGGNGKVTRSDTFHPYLFIECKLRQSFAHHTLYNDTKELAKKEKKVPVVVTKENNKNGFLITVHCDDLGSLVESIIRHGLENGEIPQINRNQIEIPISYSDN